MNQTDPLAVLRDIHLPGDPSLWPPAIGWWLLLIACLLIIWAIYKVVANFLFQRRPSKQALLELDRLESRFKSEQDTREYVQSLSMLLRRYVVSKCADPQLAARSGSHWLKLLNELSNGRAFTDGPGQVLADLPYSRTVDVNAEALTRTIRQMLRNQASFVKCLKWNRSPLSTNPSETG
ncbi:MAG: hypothetical protein ACI8P9_004362 [Parasphingorhabdus sp.]|jgi:hypothetical protein